MTIQIGIDEDAPAEHLQIECFDANGNVGADASPARRASSARALISWHW